jgi:uroporphyrinogen-III synthase
VSLPDWSAQFHRIKWAPAVAFVIMGFGGAKVLTFESRRAKEIAELIRINGGEPLVAPALMEAPLEDNAVAFQFADRLYAGEIDMVIFLTGVGTRFLGRVLATRDAEERFIDALRKVLVVARGPKPTAVLREWNVPIAVNVPEPNTWRELLAAVESRAEKRVAVQEYGRANPELLDGLAAQGREVMRVPVYQWKLPEDKAPLEKALAELLAGRVQAALVTTSVQIEHFLNFAGERRETALEALRQTFLASIGPDSSETLRSFGLEPVMEPSHPKMGLLVREAAMKYGERNRF